MKIRITSEVNMIRAADLIPVSVFLKTKGISKKDI